MLWLNAVYCRQKLQELGSIPHANTTPEEETMQKLFGEVLTKQQISTMYKELLKDSNRMKLFVFGNEEQARLVAALDNLGKGAGGAAVQNLNIMLGLPVKTKVRHVFVADDIAQLVVDWSIDGKGPDGKPVHLAGVACDVVRRGTDGRWRFVIDNNQGTAVRKPA